MVIGYKRKTIVLVLEIITVKKKNENMTKIINLYNMLVNPHVQRN